jgi:hypothetical protein
MNRRMSFLKRILNKHEEVAVINNETFWKWFIQNEKQFYQIVKERKNVDKDFLQKLMPRLHKLNSQFYCLTGMYDDKTAELVITAEGDIKTFVFVEELVKGAPVVEGWKFTALKQALPPEHISIEMKGYIFDNNKIKFFSKPDHEYPDEINIVLVHNDLNESNKDVIMNGTYIFLDNVLGELNAATLIDSVTVEDNHENQDLIPIKKLDAFLLWREMEFIEKNKGKRYNTENDAYSGLEAEDGNGLPLIAMVNQELLKWDAKASHPWMMIIEIKYNGENNNGMPGDDVYNLMNDFEDDLMKQAPDWEGYLNLGRQTYNGVRTIYFACMEFRNSTKIVSGLINNYLDKLEIAFDLFKDKYWRVMDKFN